MSGDPETTIGILSHICRRCSRPLTAKKSQMQGYGSTCYRKIMHGDTRRSKAIERAEPRTITDDLWAQRTVKAILALVARIPPESLGWNVRCAVCGTPIQKMPVESYDHNAAGMILPGFGKPQWFYLHDDHNDLAIWKLGIRDQDILDELNRTYPGEVPQVHKQTTLPAEVGA